ncbi:sialin isoform X2 [Eurytemora carolleeae]|uniref:sialin isoform X2 n=1 Tax=Eurytemora carolleeae TaxID=1294199 RepID=UPI000C7660DE|nr:sialin isoform X2 [Eurytemora carolleeae]|eukprot:XP_023342327.1 sialin-like isoform X2 [Eurytemora affinis]
MNIYKHIKCRTVLSILLFWGQIQNYMMRISLSLIIVEMVKDYSKSGTSTDIIVESCIIEHNSSSIGVPTREDHVPDLVEEEDDKLDWDARTVGLVLSSFSWGYITTQLIGGRLSEIFGFKIVYGLGLSIPGLLMLIHPIAAQTDVKLFIALRVVFGVLTGVTWPSMHVMTARWVPMTERSSFVAQSYFGSTFGLILTFPMCGYIIESFGWAACYYVIFCITMCWSLAWFTLIHDSPDLHPYISEEEKRDLSQLQITRQKHVPWKSILSSPPVWGTLITDCCNTWGIITISSYGPTYLKYVLGVDIKTNGLISGLPMIARYFGGVLFARFSGYLIKSRYLTLLSGRKIFNTVSQVLPSLLIVLMPYSGCSVATVITLQIVMFFFNGAISSGHFASGVDLTPNYAGTLLGVTNTMSGGAVGSLAPMVVGIILQDGYTWKAWTTVFWCAGIIYFIGNCFYVWLIKAEAQPWNYHNTRTETDAKQDAQEETAVA